MRFKINLFLILALLSTALHAKTVSVADAKKTAQSALLSGFGDQNRSLADNCIPQFIERDGNILIYIFQLQPKGFILISADDASYPVLAFSSESNYSEGNQPENFSAWVKGYADQISFGITSNIQADQKTAQAWQLYLAGSSTSGKSVTTSVSPLLTTTWDQGSPYNYLCPAASGGSGGHVWAGCVATAMAQVANYWRWPLQGNGSHGYYSNYGYLSANFGETFYKWEEMTSSAFAANFEMAQLQSHFGISVDMMYSPSGSGAYSDDAANSLIVYFGFNPDLHLEYAPSPIDDSWKLLLRNELDAGRPMYYHGFGTGGHAFNVDGYQGNDYFHFNWGWSGSFNGYFYLDNLNPGGNNFTEGQGAIVGIIPTGDYPYYCASTDTLTANAGTIEDGSGPVGQYLGNSNCGWLIAPTDSISSINLSFNRFDLENNVDFLTVYDGADITAPVLGSFTGSNLPVAVTSTGSKMFIKFTSSESGNAGGWFASYTSARATFCSGTTILTAPSGSVNDGSGSYDYHENSLCKYKIMPDSVQSIAITFDEFDTYDENDIFMIFNLENNELLAKLYGHENPGTLYFNASKLLIMFHSNSVNNGNGWSFHYSSSVSTGLVDPSSQIAAEIFPDPASQYLNIRFQSPQATLFNVELYSLQGKRVYNHSFAATYGEINGQIDVSGLSNGIYLLKGSTSAGMLTRRIVVNH